LIVVTVYHYTRQVARTPLTGPHMHNPPVADLLQPFSPKEVG
jgi:hypothetical protein